MDIPKNGYEQAAISLAKLLTRNDTLTGEDVVENFSCQVAQLFE